MDVQEHLKRGEEYFNQNDFDRAIAELTKALQLDPNLKDVKNYLSITYFNRGVANSQKGDSDQAIDDFTEAAELCPNEASIYGARGTIHKEKENWDEVIEDFSKVIKLAPTAYAYNNRASGYYGKCTNYRKAGNESDFLQYIDKAIGDLEKAIQVHPADENFNEEVDGLLRKRLEHIISERESRKKVYDGI